jgi:predicted GIY-YIG superfamily endonuclease
MGPAGIIMPPRNHYTYSFKVGRKVVHNGITTDLDRREREHQQRWPSGFIVQIGNAKTEEGARTWEAEQEKTITPQRKK